MSVVSGKIPLMFKGVRPGWKKILLSEKFKPLLNRCMKNLDSYLRQRGVTPELVSKNGLSSYIRPGEENVFEAFKWFDPQNLKVIIIGQDPYPNPQHAQGLSFSVPKGATVPASLRMIFETLVEQEILEKTPSHGSLLNWARQGILLLNRFLTRSPRILQQDSRAWIEGNGGSEKEFLHPFWSELTDALVEYLSGEFLRERLNHPEHKLWILLWGAEAKAMKNALSKAPLPPGKEVVVLEWGHPSPCNRVNMVSDDPRNFRRCPHFKILAEEAGIVWDPDFNPGDFLLDQFASLGEEEVDLEELLQKGIAYNDNTSSLRNLTIRELQATLSQGRKEEKQQEFTGNLIVAGVDGGCRGNGSEEAVASFGVYFPEKFLGSPTLTGEFTISGPVPRKALFLTPDLELQEEETGFVRPSNNRGELLGTIHCLIHVIQLLEQKRVACPVILIVDAEYVFHLLNERIWKYARDPTLRSTVRLNHDLVYILLQLLRRLAEIYSEGTTGSATGGGEQELWHTLIQPNSRSHLSSKDVNLEWRALTLLHQPSHLPKKQVPSPGGLAFEKWFCNTQADQLCGRVLQNI